MADLCEGKVVDLIGSGYNPKVLPPGWAALICGLTDTKAEIEEPVPIPPRFSQDYVLEDTKRVVEDVKKNLRPYWQCFQSE